MSTTIPEDIATIREHLIDASNIAFDLWCVADTVPQKAKADAVLRAIQEVLRAVDKMTEEHEQ